MQLDALTRVLERFLPRATAVNLVAPRTAWLKDGRRAVIRSTRVTDGPAIQAFVRGLSIRSRRNRFFSPISELSRDQIERITRSLPSDGLALVCEAVHAGESRIVAMAQYVIDAPLQAEFALVVHDAYQRQGLGNEMMGMLAEHAARAGLAAFVGLVLPDNWPMLGLLSRLGCELEADADPGVVRAIKRFDVHEGIRSRPIEAPVYLDPREPVRPRDTKTQFAESFMY
ncbi:MAG: GNAT family N-acetyltransferase [Betaproteobacteria bacterium]